MSALACRLPKAAVPLPASTCHSIACLNVREGSRSAVQVKRSDYRCFGSESAADGPRASSAALGGVYCAPIPPHHHACNKRP